VTSSRIESRVLRSDCSTPFAVYQSEPLCQYPGQTLKILARRIARIRIVRAVTPVSSKAAAASTGNGKWRIKNISFVWHGFLVCQLAPLHVLVMFFDPCDGIGGEAARSSDDQYIHLGRLPERHLVFEYSHIWQRACMPVATVDTIVITAREEVHGRA
jgi:hypothetical protein